MKRPIQWADIILSAAILATPLATSAAVSVDLTQGLPGYWSQDGYWTTGNVAPGYEQSASSNQLTITALPGLTNAQSWLSNPHNNFYLVH